MLCDKQLLESVKKNETTGAYYVLRQPLAQPVSLTSIVRENRYKDLDQNLTVNYYPVPSNWRLSVSSNES